MDKVPTIVYLTNTGKKQQVISYPLVVGRLNGVNELQLLYEFKRRI